MNGPDPATVKAHLPWHYAMEPGPTTKSRKPPFHGVIGVPECRMQLESVEDELDIGDQNCLAYVFWLAAGSSLTSVDRGRVLGTGTSHVGSDRRD